MYVLKLIQGLKKLPNLFLDTFSDFLFGLLTKKFGGFFPYVKIYCYQAKKVRVCREIIPTDESSICFYKVIFNAFVYYPKRQFMLLVPANRKL